MDGRWNNNALAAVVLASVLAISFTPSWSLAFFDDADVVCYGFPYPGEVFRPCLDITFRFETPGMCIASGICLGLGTVAITGAAIGIGKGVVGSILGGNSGSSGSGYPSNTMLTGGSKVGCSGTPYISLTPSSDSCAVYIPTTSTAGSTSSLLNVSRPSVSSLLFSNTSGTSASSTAGNTLLNSGAEVVNAPQADTGGQSIPSSLGGASMPAGKVSSSLLGGGLTANGVSYSLGVNGSFSSSVSNGSASDAVGLSSLLSNVSDTLLNNLTGGTGGSSASNAGTGLMNLGSRNANNPPAAGVGTSLNSYGTSSEGLSGISQNAVSVPKKSTGVQSGTWGDIKADVSGVTITAGGHGTDGRTGIAGFYGYDAVMGVTSPNLAKQMCAARPWGNLAAASIIQPSFFDSICVARGFKEAAILPAANSASAGADNATKNSGTASLSEISNAAKKVTTTAETSKAGPVLAAPAPRVDIYAVPARVRIGSRSSIYWNSKGVTSCVASSPDGSFNEGTLNGAAGTVALYANTEFTIICNTPDGSSVSNSVTVETSG